MCFCVSAIFSGSTSRPRLPREMMTPSAAATMLAKLNRDWRVSHLASSCDPMCVANGRAGIIGSTTGEQHVQHVHTAQIPTDLGGGQPSAICKLASLEQVLLAACVGQRDKVNLIVLCKVLDGLFVLLAQHLRMREAMEDNRDAPSFHNHLSDAPAGHFGCFPTHDACAPCERA